MMPRPLSKRTLVYRPFESPGKLLDYFFCGAVRQRTRGRGIVDTTQGRREGDAVGSDAV